MSTHGVLDFVLLPDIQRDGYHSVEDDDVGPEGKEPGENGVPLNSVPGQIILKVYSNQALPNGVSDGQNSSHKDKEAKDLAYRSLFYCIQIQKMLSFITVAIILLLFARLEIIIVICINR